MVDVCVSKASGAARLFETWQWDKSYKWEEFAENYVDWQGLTWLNANYVAEISTVDELLTLHNKRENHLLSQKDLDIRILVIRAL